MTCVFGNVATSYLEGLQIPTLIMQSSVGVWQPKQYVLTIYIQFTLLTLQSFSSLLILLTHHPEKIKLKKNHKNLII